jgi:hypothetical protein
MLMEGGGGSFLLLSDVPSDIRGEVRYCDRVHMVILPIGSGHV